MFSKLKISCQWRSSPRSCIGNLAVVARPISGRPGGSSRLREHQDACKRGTLKKLAVAEPVKWEMTTVIDTTRCLDSCHSRRAFTSTWIPQHGHRAWDPRMLDGCPEKTGSQDQLHQFTTSGDTRWWAAYDLRHWKIQSSGINRVSQ